jgi:hexosaminidase
MRLQLASLLVVTALPLAAQEHPALMPLPAQLTLGAGRLRVDSTFGATTQGFTDGRLRRGVLRALVRLEARIGQPVRRDLEGTAADSAARLVLRVAGPGEAVQTPEEDESYRLTISADRAELDARTVVGGLRGLETLLQLVSADSSGFYLPEARIADQPAFAGAGSCWTSAATSCHPR